MMMISAKDHYLHLWNADDDGLSGLIRYSEYQKDLSPRSHLRLLSPSGISRHTVIFTKLQCIRRLKPVIGYCECS